MSDVYEPSSGMGNSTSPRDPSRCKAGVWSRDSWSRYSQCSRKAGDDGWCKTHHPDAEAAREKASQSKYEKDARRHAMGWYGERFMAALIAIRDGDNDPRATAAEALKGCSYADRPTASPVIRGDV